MKQVNEVIILSLGLDLGGKKISERCACRWLVKLGYAMKEVRKGMYVDGHKETDVVEYCKRFLIEFAKNERSDKHSWTNIDQIFMEELPRLWHTYSDNTLEPIEPNLVTERSYMCPSLTMSPFVAQMSFDAMFG